MAINRRLTEKELTDALNRIIQDCRLVIDDLEVTRQRSQQERQFVGMTQSGLSALIAQDTDHFTAALNSVVDQASRRAAFTVSGYQAAYDTILQLLPELGACINDQQKHQMEIHENAIKITQLWGESQAALPCPN